MTQTEQIYNHLITHGTITPLEALNEYGCMRLGARIWDLRHMGHRIGCTIIRRENASGEVKRFAQYFLEGKA